LTKHEPVDAALKCPLELAEAGKVELGTVEKMLEDNVFVIRDVQVVPKRVRKPKVTAAAKANVKVSGLGKVTRKLYDLEPGGEPEKLLKIDLGLYQMEDF